VAAILFDLLIAQHGPAHKANRLGRGPTGDRSLPRMLRPHPQRHHSQADGFAVALGGITCWSDAIAHSRAALRRRAVGRGRLRTPHGDYSPPLCAGGASRVGSADSLSIAYGSCQTRSPAEFAK